MGYRDVVILGYMHSYAGAVLFLDSGNAISADRV